MTRSWVRFFRDSEKLVKTVPIAGSPFLSHLHKSVATIFLMPRASRTFDNLHLTFDRIVKCQVSSVKCSRRQGFTLIEVVLSIFIILAIVTILLIASGSYTTSRGSNLQGIAGKIASREMENLRNTAYASLPVCPSPDGCTFTDSDLSKLPSSSAKRFVDTYQSSADMKLVTIQIDWTVNGAAKQSKINTLIYKNGL